MKRVSQELKVELAFQENREILDLWVHLGFKDQLAVMEGLVLMVGTGTKENKDQLVHKDQG